MSFERKAFAPLLVAAGSATLIATAPNATADPAWPVAGAESASDTIRDLQDQGYNVAVNWVNGHQGSDLSRCSVSAIYNPDRSAQSPPPQSTTVYGDVQCPHDDRSGVGIGFGF
jgi:hypothetical protein